MGDNGRIQHQPGGKPARNCLTLLIKASVLSTDAAVARIAIERCKAVVRWWKG